MCKSIIHHLYIVLHVRHLPSPFTPLPSGIIILLSAYEFLFVCVLVNLILSLVLGLLTVTLEERDFRGNRIPRRQKPVKAIICEVFTMKIFL